MNNFNSTTVHKYTRVTALEWAAAKGTRSTQLKQSNQLSLPQRDGCKVRKATKTY